MQRTNPFEDLAARLAEGFAGTPAEDLQKNARALLRAGLARLDLVTRDEFDVQARVLARAREQIESLEKRVAELERRLDL